MDRWNELIAGYVLGNLTAEESEELEQVLAKHPQLNDRILRLRQTATLRGGLPENRITDRTADYAPTIQAENAKDYLTKGAEGWSDGVSGGPSLAPSNVHPITVKSMNSRLTPRKQTLHGQSQASSTPPPKNPRNNRNWVKACAKHVLQNSLQNPLKNPLWWILVLATIGLGIDNVRVRRSLALIKDKTTYTHMENKRSTLWPSSRDRLKTQ